MSEYKPPKEDVPVFNPRDFEYGIAGLTQSNLDGSYLNYPIAQSELREQFPAGIKVNTNVEYNNGTTQSSAFTGASAGTFTNVDMTIGSNGEISAISSGQPHTEHFTPIFANCSASQNSNQGYMGGVRFKFGGNWSADDYVLIRYNCYATWNNSANSATATGLLKVSPYYMPSNVWSGVSNPTQFPLNNQGSYIGTNNIAYSFQSYSSGADKFFTYGANKDMTILFRHQGGDNRATFCFEYLARSTAGGTLVFEEDDDGTSAITYDKLP
jgi:hypothetical protein